MPEFEPILICLCGTEMLFSGSFWPWTVARVTETGKLIDCHRQTQAGKGLQDLVAASGVGPGLGKDFSKISAFESLESSLGADAIG